MGYTEAVFTQDLPLLEFEHIVQVNDLSDASIQKISRSQLWRGLEMRARTPQKFNRRLNCQAKSLGENEFLRTIDVGSSTFCEHVILFPEKKICTSTIAEHDQIMAESTTSIEEPEAGALFVRFCYKRELDESDQHVNVGEHLKAAYVQVDRDIIAMIRTLAESELLNQSIH